MENGKSEVLIVQFSSNETEQHEKSRRARIADYLEHIGFYVCGAVVTGKDDNESVDDFVDSLLENIDLMCQANFVYLDNQWSLSNEATVLRAIANAFKVPLIDCPLQ